MNDKVGGNGGLVIRGDARHIDPAQFPQRFGVIVADPPWQYQQQNIQGTAGKQYNTMAAEELCALPVPKLCAEDCALFLWGTWPKLPEALQVLHAWSFEYVTGLPWVKLNGQDGGVQYGVGFWVRGCSEYVLIGRKGNVSPPRMEGYLGLLSPNLQHSRKPDSIHQIAESLPGPYLELFARRPRPGWTVFGNDIAYEARLL